MVKTLVSLREDLYQELAKYSLEKYGHTKAISKVLNEILENYFQKKKGWKIKVTYKLKGIDLSPENIKKLATESWIE